MSIACVPHVLFASDPTSRSLVSGNTFNASHNEKQSLRCLACWNDSTLFRRQDTEETGFCVAAGLICLCLGRKRVKAFAREQCNRYFFAQVIFDGFVDADTARQSTAGFVLLAVTVHSPRTTLPWGDAEPARTSCNLRNVVLALAWE